MLAVHALQQILLLGDMARCVLRRLRRRWGRAFYRYNDLLVHLDELDWRIK